MTIAPFRADTDLFLKLHAFFLKENRKKKSLLLCILGAH